MRMKGRIRMCHTVIPHMPCAAITFSKATRRCLVNMLQQMYAAYVCFKLMQKLSK